MKMKLSALMMAGLLTLGVVGMANAMNNSVGSNPYPVAGPHPVSMETWTKIVRSFQRDKKCPDKKPDKPVNLFPFKLKEL